MATTESESIQAPMLNGLSMSDIVEFEEARKMYLLKIADLNTNLPVSSKKQPVSIKNSIGTDILESDIEECCERMDCKLCGIILKVQKQFSKQSLEESAQEFSKKKCSKRLKIFSLNLEGIRRSIERFWRSWLLNNKEPMLLNPLCRLETKVVLP
jgi:hypothetical protein